jgi:hypothetical protein
MIELQVGESLMAVEYTGPHAPDRCVICAFCKCEECPKPLICGQVERSDNKNIYFVISGTLKTEVAK